MNEIRIPRFTRYVAIGDSSTEGLEDPDGAGGYRGWADRLAQHLADHQGAVRYANFGVRGRTTRQILEDQLEPALALRPDVATLFAGTNDAVGRHFDEERVGEDLAEMQRKLIAAGATVVGFTLPDLTPVMPLGRLVAARIERLNRMLRRVSSSTGAILVDFAADPRASDRRIWSDDGFHANALGHAGIAAALARAIGLEMGDAWAGALPPEPAHGSARRLAGDAHWMARHFVPWIWRSLRGRSAGDGRGPKQPELREVRARPTGH